jgi:hypothetical protein
MLELEINQPILSSIPFPYNAGQLVCIVRHLFLPIQVITPQQHQIAYSKSMNVMHVYSLFLHNPGVNDMASFFILKLKVILSILWISRFEII